MKEPIKINRESFFDFLISQRYKLAKTPFFTFYKVKKRKIASFLVTVRLKNFQVEKFRYLLKTFEIFKTHDLYQGVKTFEVLDILRHFWDF